MRTDEQCGYNTYNFWSSKRELLLAGKSARVHGLSFERACIGAAADLLQHEAEAANDVAFHFYQVRRSLEEKQVTIILGIRVNKYYVLLQFWK